MGAFLAGAGLMFGNSLLNARANEQQSEAAARAASEANAIALRGQNIALDRSRLGAEGIVNAGNQAAGMIGQGYGEGQATLGNAQIGSLADLYGGYSRAGGELRQGTMGARADIGAGRAASLAELYGGASRAEQTYGSQQFRDPSAAMMDPGMEFRRRQGEQAIERSAAARGGRLGGAQLKALADYNQGLASQEYGAAFARQNTLDQQRAQQAAGLAQLQYGAGSQAAQIAQQAAGQMAGYGMQGGLAGMALQQGMGQDMSRLRYGAGSDMANLQIGQGATLANLATSTAAARANALMGGSAQANSLIPTMSQNAWGAVPYAGQGAASAANSLGQLGQIALIEGLRSP